MKAPIQELMDEHSLIVRMLRVLREMGSKLLSGKSPDPADHLDAALDFIATFADHSHHGKEEDHLFPAMERAGFPRESGPVGVMLMEHRQGREFVGALRLAASDLKAGVPAAAGDAARAIAGYVDLLEHHIHKENNILYPMAMSALPEEAWANLAESFARIEEERLGPAKRAAYEALVARLEVAYPAAAPVGEERLALGSKLRQGPETGIMPCR